MNINPKKNRSKKYWKKHLNNCHRVLNSHWFEGKTYYFENQIKNCVKNLKS